MGCNVQSGNLVPTNIIGTFNGLTTTSRDSTTGSTDLTVPAGYNYIVVGAIANDGGTGGSVIHMSTGAAAVKVYLCTAGATITYASIPSGYVVPATEVIRLSCRCSVTYYQVKV
jgi:hypothetical protein